MFLFCLFLLIYLGHKYRICKLYTLHSQLAHSRDTVDNHSAPKASHIHLLGTVSEQTKVAVVALFNNTSNTRLLQYT